MSSHLFIGLMSGTSLDGADVALVDFSTSTPQLIATHYQPLPEDLRQQTLALNQPGSQDELHQYGELDIALGDYFAEAVLTLLANAGLDASDINAIGSHGQTLRHQPPPASPAYTLQIGDPNTIAQRTGITTVGDFRRRDIAAGGQGAPLAPAFHHQFMADSNQHRVIVNIGGMANITLLDAQHGLVAGYDTGPGNCLMDGWIQYHQPGTNYDTKGQWARSGSVNPDLLSRLYALPFFQQGFPKSTGREQFNLSWLREHLDNTLAPQDIQATVLELTARSISDAIQQLLPESAIYVCGGGAHNEYLLERLQVLTQRPVHTTHAIGIDPDWVEAMTFAWLAKQTLARQTGNHPQVTGAAQQVILGGIYPA